MEEIHEQGEAYNRQVDQERDVKITKLSEEDDIEAYLTTFERCMQAYKIPAAGGHTNLLHSWWGRPSKPMLHWGLQRLDTTSS